MIVRGKSTVFLGVGGPVSRGGIMFGVGWILLFAGVPERGMDGAGEGPL